MLLLAVWTACTIAALLYAQQYNIPAATAWAVLPAFLLEATFFCALADDRIRKRIEQLTSVIAAGALTVAAVAPYVFATLALHTFNFQSFLLLAILGAVASFWYVVVPKRPLSDVLFLAFMGAVMLLHVFPKIYVSPIPKLPISPLGQAMWVRTGVFVMLAVRGVSGVDFGFWPSRKQWQIGTLYYFLFLIVAVGVAWKIGFATPHFPPGGWQRASLLAVGTFLGVLWVLALGEEFFFRGLLQQWIGSWTRSEIAGLILTSILFGSVHLWFRAFPNWRFALLAAIAGLFYGQAFRQTRSIRTSMVTHALVVTTWRVFFW